MLPNICNKKLFTVVIKYLACCFVTVCILVNVKRSSLMRKSVLKEGMLYSTRPLGAEADILILMLSLAFLIRLMAFLTAFMAFLKVRHMILRHLVSGII